mmetsp:Transcript_21018/g.3396  ORF Transcript_21018/g.3396 Transcript_21018/m.3396 type:complete len:82 (+) Transcript_21018:191-436(+)
MEEILRATNDLLNNQDTMIPIYDFSTHSRRSNKQFVQPSRLIIFEGIYALYDSRLTDNMILKIFVQTDDDIRLCRRIKRDI